jgi:hypothetical protein
MPLVLSAYCPTTAWAWYRNSRESLSVIAFPGWGPKWTFAATGAMLHAASWGLAVSSTLVVAAIRSKGEEMARADEPPNKGNGFLKHLGPS